MKGRIYDPLLGRFLQPDPIVEDDLNPQTWNRYTYVRNNPMTFTDPTGYATRRENHEERERAIADKFGSFWGMFGGLGMASQRGSNSDSSSFGTITPKGSTSAASSNAAGGTVEIGEIQKEGISNATPVGGTGLITITPLPGDSAARIRFVDANGNKLVDQHVDIDGYRYTFMGLQVSDGREVWEGRPLLSDGRLEASSPESFFPFGTVAKGAAFLFGVSKLAPVAVVKGEAGGFAELLARSVKGDKLTPHHMPQAAAGFTSRGQGGALVLPEAEHVMTRTYGYRGAVTARQEAGMPFRVVLARDIRDVRGIAGSQYNQGLRDLLQYYRTNFPALIAK